MPSDPIIEDLTFLVDVEAPTGHLPGGRPGG